jgi:hypothetical protein
MSAAMDRVRRNTNGVNITAVYADPRVAGVAVDATYQADISWDGGRTWAADTSYGSVCGGHVQAEIVATLLAGRPVASRGRSRTVPIGDGSVTRWTPTR